MQNITFYLLKGMLLQRKKPSIRFIRNIHKKDSALFRMQNRSRLRNKAEVIIMSIVRNLI
ncbi:unknown [Prevotella sp. CAG:1058]|nr:unknown [Prevotella sp. CAG:1058]